MSNSSRPEDQVVECIHDFPWFSQDTGGPRGVILCVRAAVAEGGVVLRERALVLSAATASAANAALWEELEVMERSRALGGGSVVPGVHAAACCAIRDLGVGGVRQRLLCQCGDTSLNPRAESAVFRHLAARHLVPHGGVTTAEYAKLLGVIKLNAFHFEPEGSPSDVGKGGLGKALFQYARMANHSCDPNVRYTFSWDPATGAAIINFIACRPLSHGEEVFISYLDVEELATLSRVERRQKLRSTWGFDCDCSRCEEEASATNADDLLERVPTPPLTGLEW